MRGSWRRLSATLRYSLSILLPHGATATVRHPTGEELGNLDRKTRMVRSASRIAQVRTGSTDAWRQRRGSRTVDRLLICVKVALSGRQNFGRADQFGVPQDAQASS